MTLDNWKTKIVNDAVADKIISELIRYSNESKNNKIDKGFLELRSKLNDISPELMKGTFYIDRNVNRKESLFMASDALSITQKIYVFKNGDFNTTITNEYKLMFYKKVFMTLDRNVIYIKPPFDDIVQNVPLLTGVSLETYNNIVCPDDNKHPLGFDQSDFPKIMDLISLNGETLLSYFLENNTVSNYLKNYYLNGGK